MLQLDNPVFDSTVAQYMADMEALANRAYAGELDEREYREEVERLTIAVLLALFLLAGGNQARGAAFLAEQGLIARDSARALASDLFDGRYSESEDKTAEEARASLSKRFELWTFTLGQAFHVGMLTAVFVGEEPRFKWKTDPRKKNCDTCKGLNGIVLTGSEWLQSSWQPQGDNLDCQGFYCGCTLQPTDEPSMGLETMRAQV